MAIRPIRLFGDPILRRRAIEVVDFDKELRTLVADLTDTMLDAPGAGLAAPQIGVGLRVFTWYVEGEVGHLVNPTLELSEEIQDGLEGCLSLPELTYECKRAMSVVAHGFDMYGEPVTIDGSELLARAIQHETDHLDGDPVHRQARHRRPQGRDEGDPRVRLVRGREADRSGSARTAPTGWVSDGMRLVFAGTPEVALPALDAVAASRPRAGRRRHPPRRPGRPRPQAGRQPGRAARRGARRTGAQARPPARPRLPGRAARPRPGLLPGGGVRRPPAAVGARHPRARLGQPALLGAPGLARCRAGPARDLGRATRSPARRRSGSSRSSTPGRRSA